MDHTSYWYGTVMYGMVDTTAHDPHPTPITQSITGRVSEQTYDDSEKNGGDRDEEKSSKPLNAAFRLFHCSFQSDSKFIVP